MLGTLLSKGKTLSEARTEGQRNSYMGELTFHAEKNCMLLTVVLSKPKRMFSVASIVEN